MGFFSASVGITAEPQLASNPSTPPTVGRQTLYSKPAKTARVPRKRRTAKKTLAVAKPVAVQAAPEAARIESVRQNVEIQPSGADNWVKASNKHSLQTSDRIRTGKQSVARIKMEDGTKILLLQNSQAEIENMSSVQKTIKLLRGRVRAVVTKIKGTQSFSIKTPIGVASVRGTEFEVEFQEDGEKMQVDVHSGSVGVSKLGDLANEVIVNPGESIKFGLEGDMGDPIKSGAAPLNNQDIRNEVVDSKVKDAVIAQAAEDLRNADYQTGKSLIDVDGKRVRVEEYISRPAANQYKLVSLNERDDRFDYFTYTGTFNQNLPEDLSIALRQVGGRLGSTAPEYYLTAYEMLLSNTIDNVNESASGGHRVRIDFDGTTYTLTNPDTSETHSIEAAEDLNNGTFKIYNPLTDKFTVVNAADVNAAKEVTISDEGTYRNFANTDVYWKTRFDSLTYSINGTVKTSYTPKLSVSNILALDLDGLFSDAPIGAQSTYPEGSGSLHNRLTLYYADGSVTTYDNYIIDDEGNIAPASAFAGVTSGEEYKGKILDWNYQQKIKSTEMSGEINLVIDPRIGTLSGLIQ